MPVHELTRAHRSDLIVLSGLAQRDLRTIWARISTATDATVVRDDLTIVLPKLVSIYGAAAATLAADYYDEMRDAEQLGSRFTAIAVELPGVGRTDALAGWAVAPLFGAEPDADTALSLISGGLQRIVTDASRDTITGSAVADPHNVSWERTVSAGACDYCSEREGSDDTSAHDHCYCGVQPHWA